MYRLYMQSNTAVQNLFVAVLRARKTEKERKDATLGYAESSRLAAALRRKCTLALCPIVASTRSCLPTAGTRFC